MSKEIKKTGKFIFGKELNYFVDDNGYTILLEEEPWVSQYNDYSKPIDENKSIEENCILQIEKLAAGDAAKRAPSEVNSDIINVEAK